MDALWERLTRLKITSKLLLPVGCVVRDEGRVINVRGATYNATRDQDSKILALTLASGNTIVLPAALGTGMRLGVMVATTVTSNNHIVKVSNTTDVLTGGVIVSSDDAADAIKGFEPAASDDTLTLNGTTKGGLIGDLFEFIDLKAGFWLINGRMTANGTEVTPFSATV